MKNEDENAGNGETGQAAKGSKNDDKGEKGNDQGADGDDGLACLIDPNTGKKMTKKRMHQLAQFGALPPSQIEELKERGFLLQSSTIPASKLKQIASFSLQSN